jgi:hypothetical protein
MWHMDLELARPGYLPEDMRGGPRLVHGESLGWMDRSQWA